MQQFSLAYHSIYTRNWRVVGAIWILSGLSTTFLQTLVLIHPTWIGSDDGGYFGLYDYCGTNECQWSPFRIRSLSIWFQISAFSVLSATVLSFMAIFAILLLVVLRDRHAFIICSWLHFFSFLFMLAGCAIFPNGWENPRVREICESKKYSIGLCQLRWPYLLAIVLIIDQLCLCCLGFALALKKPPKLPEFHSLTGTQTTLTNTNQPVPRPRKMSIQESYYSHSGSRMEFCVVISSRKENSTNAC